MRKKKLCIYITAGYPKLDDTIKLIQSLDRQGVDYIEIGMPYSDPLADGATIQKTSKIALENGMKLNLLFDQLEVTSKGINAQLIYMGYFNPLIQYGLDRFILRAKSAGIVGCIIPDLPMELYQSTYQSIFNEGGLGMNFLVSPTTTNDRIIMADQLSDQYLYVISQNTITGTLKDVTDAQIQYYERLNQLPLTKEKLIGFGIHDRASFDFACQYADGAIIGSAYLQAIGESENPISASERFVHGIVGDLENEQSV